MSEEKKADLAGIVTEELDLLARVQRHLAAAPGKSRVTSDYDAELIALRDAIAEARAEDIPPLVEHMTRLQALAAQRGLGEELPVDPASPYFGHLRLSEEGGDRDVLLGKRTYLAPDSGIRIVDWRNAPVSRMYYCYDEGDDYEEEFGGKVRRGEIAARRSVTILDGSLRRVSDQDGVFVKRAGEWQRLEGDGPKLSGGQGASVRADGLSSVRGKLGVDHDGVDRRDKHLPEISALLDKNQFELISSTDTSLLVVQGSAGSGKTTVGLHRIAYLAFQRHRGIRARNSIVVVLNPALASYVAGVLPALGVNGVKVTTFEKWSAALRRRHVNGLPLKYSEWTPTVVSRLKKHPAMLRILDDLVDDQDERLTEDLRAAVEDSPEGKRVMEAWRVLRRMPLEARRRRLARWVDGEARIGRDRGDNLSLRTQLVASSALERMAEVTEDVVSDWWEIFTDRVRLGEAVGFHAPAEFTDGELDTVHEWCVRMYKKIDAMVEGEEDDEDDPPCIDHEDDTLLLRLHQLKKGWLMGQRGRLEYDHMMIDEVQDFSALEVRTLIDTVGRDRSVTLAGDTAQRIHRDTGFDNWGDFLNDIGVQGARLEPLKIAYRSTVQVMEVAREVLGPLAGEMSVAHRRGAPVEVHQFSDPGQAVDFLGTALRELSVREPMANVAVIARHSAQARMYYQGLQKSEVPRLALVVDQDFSFSPGVEVTDVHQVKGLEFDYVIMVETNADSYPANDESRHLLHVGITRAAHQLWLLTTGKPSPLIPERFVSE